MPRSSSSASSRWGRILLSGSFAALAILGPMSVHAAGTATGNKFVMEGANAYIDVVCEKSGTNPLLSGDKYYNQSAAAENDNTSYGGTVLLADDFSDTGSDNVSFGMRSPFSGLAFKISTPGTAGSVLWKYWSGSMWKHLELKQDGTEFFRKSGINKVIWDVPSDWSSRRWPPFDDTEKNECQDRRSLYWVMVETDQNYNAQPIASQISGIVPNLDVKVVTELGDLVIGIQSIDFAVSSGDRLEVSDVHSVEDGVYRLALDTSKGDRDFDLVVHPPGFLPSQALATGSMEPFLADRRGSPLVVKYPIKVVVEDSNGHPVPGAKVTWRGIESDASAENASVHYFSTTFMGAGEIAVTAPGHEPFSASANTAARNVFAGILQQTHIKLSGSSPCATASETASGTSVTCAGLKSLGGSATTATSAPATSKPISFSFPTPSRASVLRTSVSATPPPGPPCDPASIGVAESYTKAVEHVASDELVRVCMDHASSAGVERVDVALGLEAQRVELRVEPVPEFKTQWSADGVDDPPGDYQFGFVTVGLSVDGVPWTGPVQATTFRFHVSRAALAQSGLHAGDVQVYRWDGDAWEAVPTSVDTESESDYAFSASAPGQGLFAVSGVSAVEAPGLAVWPWIVGGLVAISLVGVGVATAVRRHHMHVHELPIVPPPPTAPAQSPPKDQRIPFIK